MNEMDKLITKHTTPANLDPPERPERPAVTDLDVTKWNIREAANLLAEEVLSFHDDLAKRFGKKVTRHHPLWAIHAGAARASWQKWENEEDIDGLALLHSSRLLLTELRTFVAVELKKVTYD